MCRGEPKGAMGGGEPESGRWEKFSWGSKFCYFHCPVLTRHEIMQLCVQRLHVKFDSRHEILNCNLISRFPRAFIKMASHENYRRGKPI